jgi:hypothetical protein
MFKEKLLMRVVVLVTVLVAGIQAVPFSLTSAIAEPLQGSVQESETIPHIQGPNAQPNSTLRGDVNDSRSPPQKSGLVDTSQFTPVDQKPGDGLPSTQPVLGGTIGGQDEYWVDWEAWQHRIGSAIFASLANQVLWGQTRVDFEVTRDHHIRILSAYSPDPTGRSAMIYANATMRLDGNPILEFPAGSQKLIHRTYEVLIGPPTPGVITTQLYGRSRQEHVIRQW